MIAGNIIDLGKYIDPSQAKAIRSFLDNINLEEPKTGEWIFLTPELKVLLLNKSNFTEGVFESHTIYKDVHIVIKGNDTLYFANHSVSKETKVYDADLDYTLYNSIELYRTNLLAQSFVLIDQYEQHSNQITDNQTLKLVAKIK